MTTFLDRVLIGKYALCLLSVSQRFPENSVGTEGYLKKGSHQQVGPQQRETASF